MEEKKVVTKYKFRPIMVNGDLINLTWLYDSEVEEAMRKKTGKLISLSEAAEIYFKDIYDLKTGFNSRISDQNILGYAHSLGYRVDVLSDLVVNSHA